ncbi:MAG: hypothetical protein PV358_18595 [Acidimicrobiales bacterium]|nr:hypothetical protein [Acidimicrobiales bacterium]
MLPRVTRGRLAALDRAARQEPLPRHRAAGALEQQDPAVPLRVFGADMA